MRTEQKIRNVLTATFGFQRVRDSQVYKAHGKHGPGWYLSERDSDPVYMGYALHDVMDWVRKKASEKSAAQEGVDENGIVKVAVTVGNLVEAYLKEGGYDGLYNSGLYCACEIGDLSPCSGFQKDCYPGYYAEDYEDGAWGIVPIKQWTIEA